MRHLSELIHVCRQQMAVTGAAALERLSLNAWPVLHATVAAMVAWVIAERITHDHDPFFAPVAAVAALNASGGERGINAVRMLLGVIIGIPVAEIAILVIGGGYPTLAVAAGLAMMIAVALGAERIVIGQAAAGAILTVAVADGQYGFQRLTDALIGAGVAVVISQLLFPVRLVAMLRRTEAKALLEMASMLTLTSRTLEQEHSLTQETINRLGELSVPLSELSNARESSHRAIRHSTIRLGDLEPIMHEEEKVDRLILLGESCLSLARTATSMSPAERRVLAPAVREMASALDVLASDLSEHATRQRAVDRALDAARPFSDLMTAENPLTAATHLAVQLVAIDIMLFAGIEDEDPEEVLRDESGEPKVTRPPAVPWLPWVSWRPQLRLAKLRRRLPR